MYFITVRCCFIRHIVVPNKLATCLYGKEMHRIACLLGTKIVYL